MSEREIRLVDCTDDVLCDWPPGEAYENGEDRATKSIAPRSPLDWCNLEGDTPPPRDWAIHQWLGMGHVTLLAGAGGIGKTAVAQAIGSCLTLGRDYIDTVPEPRRVLMWAAEDDKAELWRRQAAIARWLNVPLGAFGDFILHSYDGESVDLASLIDQRLVGTSMYDELCAQIVDYKADVVTLDNVARLYGGNENDRHQVTTFVAMLTKAARPTNAAVLLLAHPGKAAGSEYSGSTAWEGSVRSRLYLGRTLPDTDIETEADDDVRFLSRRKANYSPRDWRRIRYADGAMIPEAAEAGYRRIGPEYAADVVRRAIRKLTEIGQHGAASRSSPRYLPKIAAEYSLLEDLSKAQFGKAMCELQKAGGLVTGEVGKYANRSPQYGLLLPEEAEK